MKNCVHCGKELNDNVEICMSCGCYADAKFTVTFNRKSQFYLVNPAVKVEVSGNGVSKRLEIKNGESTSIKLTPGEYNIHFYASIRSTDVKLDLKRNTSFQIAWNRVTGQLEVIKEK